jgi:LysM repeat protein
MEAVRSALLTQTAQAGQGGGAATSTPTPGAAGLVTATPIVGTPAAGLPTVTRTLPPIPTLVVPSSYTLHEGEFPYCLGRRFNRNPDDILAVNGLKSDSVTVPGQTLSIPSSGTFPGPRALLTHPASYTVLGGETIYSLACYYGDVDPMAIAAANGLSSPYTLMPGTNLQIP